MSGLKSTFAWMGIHGFKLFPYQKQSVEIMTNNEKDNKGGLLCDEPGLGKTVQIMSLMKMNQLKTLIILPISLIDQWIDSLKKVFNESNIENCYKNRFNPSKTKLITIISYGKLISKESNLILNKNWGRIIIDECHFLKNPKSKISQVVQKMSRNKIIWGITGTPIQNSKKDIETLKSCIGLSHMENDYFVYNYVIRRKKSQVSNENKALELPEMTVNNIEVPFTDHEEELYEQLKKDGGNMKNVCGNIIERNSELIINTIMDENKNKNSLMYILPIELIEIIISFYTFNNFNYRYYDVNYDTNYEILSVFMKLRQFVINPIITAKSWKRSLIKSNNYDETTDKIYNDLEGLYKPSSKITKMMDIINNIPSDDKIIIFCQWNDEIDDICKNLNNKFKIGIVNGSISNDERTQIINNKDIKILIMQIRTGNYGLNLQDYNNIIIINPDWNPCNEIQAYARAHRIGQSKQVKIWKLISTSSKCITPDQYIIKKQIQKREIIGTILKDDEFIEKQHMYESTMSISEMKNLII